RPRQGSDDRRRAGPAGHRDPRRARARAGERGAGGGEAARAAGRQGRPLRERAARRAAAVVDPAGGGRGAGPAHRVDRGSRGDRARGHGTRGGGGRAMTRTLISGGLVVTAAEETQADVLIEDEKVVALTAPGLGLTADTVIDATGCYVIPGGVDAHTH